MHRRATVVGRQFPSMLVGLLLLACVNSAWGWFYLPGTAPREYQEEEELEVDVNKITSIHTQLPYKYYELPFCRPEVVEDTRESLGEILMGDIIESSLYKLRAKVNQTCVVVCKKTFKKADIAKFAEKVRQEYRAHWLLDSLPAAEKHLLTNGRQVYEDGFAVGFMHRKESSYEPALNNHVALTVLYHEEPTNPSDPKSPMGIRVVGFEAKGYSVSHNMEYPADGVPDTCSRIRSVSPVTLDQSKEEISVVFTFSAAWVRSNIKWASRWDAYFMMTEDQVHWFSILNSALVVLFLTGIVAMILLRVLRADLRRYNAQRDEEGNDVLEETGWKLVHADVFRAPSWPMLLSASVGSGVQTLAMTIITMCFALLGFLSPANRGSLMTAMVVLLVVMGILNGYFATRTYKMFKGIHWKRCTLLAMFLYPGVAFSIFLVINFMISGMHSSGAIPFLTLFELILLWFGVSLPLTFAGAYFGFKGESTPEPSNIRVNQIPRQIPCQQWYAHPVVSVLLGGVLPFGAILIELFFIWSSIWLHQFYYLFGFLFLVGIILAVTCAEIAIVMCYLQLCGEDYHWWWRAFLTPAASAFYLFLFSVFFFLPKLKITKLVSIFLYVGYTFIITLEFFTLTGVVGFFACYWFVYTIYASIKVE